MQINEYRVQDALVGFGLCGTQRGPDLATPATVANPDLTCDKRISDIRISSQQAAQQQELVLSCSCQYEIRDISCGWALYIAERMVCTVCLYKYRQEVAQDTEH